MNNITICGRLTKDVEIKKTENSVVGVFSIADNYAKDDTMYWNCVVFGKQAETLEKYKKKGDAITIVGNITNEHYKDKIYTKIKVEHFYFN